MPNLVNINTDSEQSADDTRRTTRHSDASLPGLQRSDSDDDDMDFEPDTEGSEEVDFFDTNEDTEVEFHDAEDQMDDVQLEIEVDSDEPSSPQDTRVAPSERSGPQTRSQTRGSPQRIEVPSSLIQLLGNAGFRQFVVQNGRPSGDDEDDGDERSGNILYHRQRHRGSRQGVDKSKFPAVPNEEGRRLMNTNIFGLSDYYQDTRRRRSKRLSRKLMARELGGNPASDLRGTRAIAQNLIPSSSADSIIHYDSRCYSGQFSDDGNFFFSCAQDFKVRMYDTSNPYHWKYYKTVDYSFGQWTITDASLSPDNKYLAYSSIRNIVCLAPTDPNETGEPWVLDFSNPSEGGSGMRTHYSHFGIWSLRFSGSGREIVAGTSDHSVYVYDIERRQSVLRIQGHNDHVNAVCFGDSSSPHILYSGSDDTLIKVWDRRSMGDSREAGVFMGHTEGLTYVDSKGDGRYVLSNGKDQTMKLWDLRKMMSTEKASTIDAQRYTTSFDYRFMAFSEADWQPHPHDGSIVTFRGHSVLKTLIRCHFSPPGSTNSRYVYTGSEDGNVYIYNMDATLAGKIDVSRATYNSRPRDPSMEIRAYAMEGSRGSWKTCVRDASWHPNAPIIAATSWNGWGMGTGTCTTHSWNDGAEEDEGIPGMGQRVNQKLQRDKRFYDTKQTARRGNRVLPRLRSRFVGSDDLEDDDDGEDWW